MRCNARRAAAWALLLVVCWLAWPQPCACASEFVVEDPAAPTATPLEGLTAASPSPLPMQTPGPLGTPLAAREAATIIGCPPLDVQGFLAAKDGEPFVMADEAQGQWAYIGNALRVDIQRRQAKVRGKMTIWFIAHIYFRDGLAFRSFCENPAKPQKGKEKPEKIAQRHQVVYAQNGDLFTWRLEEKKYPGIIIRDGKILYQQTYSRRVAVVAPLDELSLYPDGHMEIHYPGEISAQQYIDRGASDVFAFGPALIRDGIRDERLPHGYTSMEPRSAIGLAGPGHAVGIMVEGRNKRSAGAPLTFVAERLAEEGCTQAYNLDGGQTAAMVFMGQNVMDPGIYHGYHKTRRQPDVIGIGTFTTPAPQANATPAHSQAPAAVPGAMPKP